MSKLHEASRLGHAIWFDFIRRSLLASGGFQALIDKGVTGVTSNPTIFHKAISAGSDYDADLQRLVAAGADVALIYETLALDDIRHAADLLLPVHEQTQGVNGYVSLEVNPGFAYDTDRTVKEARRFFSVLDRPNILIKVPATPAGVAAIETLISEGVNVNATLIFSLAQYVAVSEAYTAGLERRAAKGQPVSTIASVASFFLSRVDAVVDQALEDLGNGDLQGKIAIANAKVAYGLFRESVSSDRWQRLSEQGAQVQRPLWASTGTKNPSYPDTMYVDELIGPWTVNTVPPSTLDAFLDHGTAELTLESGLDEAQSQLARLDELGVDLDAITQALQDDGVVKFANSFDDLMEAIGAKCRSLRQA